MPKPGTGPSDGAPVSDILHPSIMNPRPIPVTDRRRRLGGTPDWFLILLVWIPGMLVGPPVRITAHADGLAPRSEAFGDDPPLETLLKAPPMLRRRSARSSGAAQPGDHGKAGAGSRTPSRDGSGQSHDAHLEAMLLNPAYLDLAPPEGDAAPLPGLLAPDRLESRDTLGLTPLLVSALKADLATAAVLIDLGSDPRAADPQGDTVLHLSLRQFHGTPRSLPPAEWFERKRRHPVGTLLLQDFVWPEPTPIRRSFDLFFSTFLDVDIVPRRSTPLSQAPAAIAFFLACGADASATNRAGETILSMALDPRLQIGDPARTRLLTVLQRASRLLDTRDSEGNTPLHRLARSGWASEILTPLLAAGADIHSTNHAGRTPLHEAAGSARDSGLLPELLRAGPAIEARDAEGRTPLLVAAASGVATRPMVFEALLRAGADARATDRDGRSAAHLLLDGAWPWDGVAECLGQLARAGADLGAADRQGRTPLHGLAALRGGTSPLFFLRLPADLFAPGRVDFNARDARGDTPLHLAARGGDRDLFEWFVARGARLDAANARGETPGRIASATDFPSIVARRTVRTDLFLAIDADDGAAVESILASDPESIRRARPDGTTPLRRAADQRRTRIIDILHRQGVPWDPFSAVIAHRWEALQGLLVRSPGILTNTESGRNLLHAATQHGDLTILKGLLAAGADPQAVDLWGLSPLGIAQALGRTEIEAALRAKGLRETVFDAVYAGRVDALNALLRTDGTSARTNNAFGVSAAAVAAVTDQAQVLKALLDAGCPVDLVDQAGGRSLLHFAAIRNATNSLRVLLKAGAPKEALDWRGLTPLHHAASAGAGAAVTLLIQAGADLEARSHPARPQFRGMEVDFTGCTPLHLAAISAETNALKALLEAGASTRATDQHRRTPRELVVTPESRLFDLDSDALTLCRPFGNGISRRDLAEQQRIARLWLSTDRRSRP
jgi:ankyrin repeat protein